MADDNQKIFLTIGIIGIFLTILMTTPGFSDVFGLTGNEGTFGMAILLIVVVAVLVYVAQEKKT